MRRTVDQDTITHLRPGHMKVVTLDERELMVRMAEAMAGVDRPDGMPLTEVLDEIKAKNAKLFKAAWNCARTACEYVQERLEAATEQPLQ